MRPHQGKFTAPAGLTDGEELSAVCRQSEELVLALVFPRHHLLYQGIKGLVGCVDGRSAALPRAVDWTYICEVLSWLDKQKTKILQRKQEHCMQFFAHIYRRILRVLLLYLAAKLQNENTHCTQ